MKKVIIVLLVVGFELCITIPLFAQSTASVTWPLTGDSSPSAPIGNITGQAESFSNMVVRNYFYGSCQKSAPDAAGTWPAEASENSARYIQFAVSPLAGNSLRLTSISFTIGWSGTTDHMFANTYYSIHPTFALRTQLNADRVITLNNRDSALISYSLNVTVPTEHTFYFRIYPWDNRDVAGKNCGLANLKIAGTTVPGNAVEQEEDIKSSKIEEQSSSIVAQTIPASDTTDVPFEMPEVRVPVFPDRTVSIVDHGAVADGHTMNTQAFAEAIHACAKAGGGKVVVPAGVWLTGPIKFESNINLYVERGAVILFSKNRNDFPLIPYPSSTSKNFSCANPISGYKLENIAITGDGIIDGSGEVWRPMKKDKYTANQWKHTIASGGVVSEDGKMWWPSQQAMQGEEYLRSLKKSDKKVTMEEFVAVKDYLRPNMVVFFRCSRVLLDGPTFQNSPKFNINPVQCEDVTIRNIKVLTDWNAQNGDGIDIGSCHNVVVSHCMLDVGDDAICLKPGIIEKGQNWTAACENILITDCVVYHGHGGFVIGSETYGGTRNVLVRNCTFIGTDVGLRFKSSRDRGGLTEKIYIDGIQMKDISRQAILFDTYYEDDKPESGEARTSEPVTARTPRFQKFYIKNVVCNSAEQAIFIQGLPEQFIRDIKFTDIIISAKKGVSCIDAEGLKFTNVRVLLEQGPVYKIDNARNITIQHPMYTAGADLFMKVEGKQSDNIQLIDADVSKAKNQIELGKDVGATAVIQK